MKKQKKREYLVSVSKIGAIRERRIQTSGLLFLFKTCPVAQMGYFISNEICINSF